MHVMQEQIEACNPIMIFGVHELVIQVILLDQIIGAKLSVYTKQEVAISISLLSLMITLDLVMCT